MAIFRSFNNLVTLLLDGLRLSQPELDTKPGTVARDVFVDVQAQQLAQLYSELRNVANLQSFTAARGSDLNRLGSNFGASRIQGSSATGVAVLTTNNLDTDVFIALGTTLTARNGITYRTTAPATMRTDNINVHRATATRLRSELDLASITDEFAIEVNAEALVAGTVGNISRFSLVSHNISGISSVTNLQAFSGGSDTEGDDEFRTRILSIFAGSNTGTALGYSTAVDVISGVQDSIVVVPGDPLLIRDGTQTSTDLEGNAIILEAGTGGKVDIYILGSQLESQIESFIFNDQSGVSDPTDPDNDIILGQGGADTTLNIAQRRVELIDDLPLQPVDGIISVVGSSSGANFAEKFTDDQGRERGNFELVKDTGDFGGSPFGFDRLRWTSNEIELDNESITKGSFNGSDELTFSDVNRIREITQNFLVTNENSTTSTQDRSSVTLLHTPVVSVSRITNLTTGERYVVENQNPDGVAGELNTTGRITISGSTLPVGTDVLQVDYTWERDYDRVFNYDNLEVRNSNRTAQDSVDWSFGNLVVNEPVSVVDDGYGVLTATVTHSVFKMITVNTFATNTVTVSDGSVAADQTISNLITLKRNSDNAELFNTDIFNGALLGTDSVILPTDTLGEDGDVATLTFNASDVFAPDGYDPGSFDGKVITLPEGVTTGGTPVLVTYVADVSTLLPEQNISDLPVIKSGNNFLVNDVVSGEQPTSNIIDSSDNFTQNLRKAASRLRVDVGSISTTGSVTISGIVRRKVTDALVVVTAGSGFEVDLQSAIKTDLNVTNLSSSIQVTKLVSFERVNVDNAGDITSVDNTYDIVNYKLQDNSYDLDVALSNSSLNNTKIELPETSGNTEALLNTGDIVRVTFYYIDDASSELLFFSKIGTRVTDQVFVDVSRVALGSGFKLADGTIEGTVVIQNFNQPISNTSYDVDYDYVAPKENERITVTFNHNSLINSATQSIESVRPITADVLIKEAQEKIIDVDIRIVLLPDSVALEQTVIQDSIDAVNSFLTASSLGTTVDASDVINNLYTVSGVDRVRIINFSTGDSGNLLSITAERNEFLSAGTINVELEER